MSKVKIDRVEVQKLRELRDEVLKWWKKQKYGFHLSESQHMVVLAKDLKELNNG